MTRLKPRRPSPGTVMGFLALCVALAGNANALGTHVIVRKGDIAPGAVTARSLAKGAVHPKALAKGAVTSRKLRKGAVTAPKLASGATTARTLAPNSVTAAAIRPASVGAAALAPDSVTSVAIAPGSVYGGALGQVDLHKAAIHDRDEVAENGTWTNSDSANISCSPGEHLLTGGFTFTNPGNREVAPLESLPYVTSSGLQGMIGQITSNSGGGAEAEVEAICLK